MYLVYKSPVGWCYSTLQGGVSVVFGSVFAVAVIV